MTNEKQMTPKDLIKNMIIDINISWRDLVNSNEALRMLASNQFPTVLSYKISRALRIMDTKMEEFMKVREVVMKKYGKEDPKDLKKYLYEEGKEKLAGEEIEKLLNEELTIKITPISLSELEGYNLEPKIFALLDWYIKE